MGKQLGTVDTSRIMDERAWWDLWNTSYRTKINNDPVSSELFDRAAAVVNGLSGNGQGRILEVACGTGTLSRMLRYRSYHGLDISPAAIELARQKMETSETRGSKSQWTYEVADFCEWQAPAEQFDMVICIDAISSIRDQAMAMKKMADSVRIGGYVVLTTINRFVYDRIRRVNGVKLQSGPVSHWLYRSELVSLVRAAGLKIETARTIMPRGDMGLLRIVNSGRLNNMFGARCAGALKRWKEMSGLGQYSLVVARR